MNAFDHILDNLLLPNSESTVFPIEIIVAAIKECSLKIKKRHKINCIALYYRVE